MMFPGLIGIGLIIYFLMDKDSDRDRDRDRQKGNRSDFTALDILNNRLARGEINEDEYKLKKKLLEESLYR